MTALNWSPAYVGIGANLEDPADQVRDAMRRLADIPKTRLLLRSGLYRNPPMGPVDQPDYVNAVVGLLTHLAPEDLLSELLSIEERMGRRRQSGGRWGPRVIDLDLLLYGDRIIDRRNLSVPHPGISERNFVLFPLLDIAPELAIPGQGKVATMANGLDSSALQRIAQSGCRLDPAIAQEEEHGGVPLHCN